MSNPDQVELVVRMLLAFGLGAAVGLEREFRGHEAGVRTMGLACLGAAIFGEVSSAAGDSRIAAGVVQGVGFLAAGVVFQRGSGVIGLTTAVTVWVMAGIGLFVAEDLLLAAVLLTAGVILTLELSPVSEWVAAKARPDAAARRFRETMAAGEGADADEE
ncbi:MAG TPA: MgtC/SapB family protein [Tepidiformaceae bacterium]|nr:MgtC/SapB family protein [Tepidiformaceae bacterium]